ncbi:MarR family winged helix-turn-helix transcriptional regulator [Micrococcus porci]|uniref:MarR family winged helix-turn-helix transcriptional regulator n=1 Tax=Micrococcus porci TaxID=2856555 RepID=UPI003CF587A5
MSDAARPASDPVADTAPESVVPWLDDEERHAFLALMSVVLRLEPTLDAQLRREAGISHFEYTVLASLSEAEGGQRRMSELAYLSSGSLPRLSQVVTRLEKRGWVERRPDPEDGRYTLAVLLDAGREVVVAAAPGHVAEVRRAVVDPLTRAQLRQLTAIGRRIMGVIDPEDRCLED